MSGKSTIVKTLPTLAKELGVDRSTLVRLEQKGIIAMAPLVGKPVQGRVYDEALEKKVKGQFEAYMAEKVAKAAKQGPRPVAPSNVIIRD